MRFTDPDISNVQFVALALAGGVLVSMWSPAAGLAVSMLVAAVWLSHTSMLEMTPSLKLMLQPLPSSVSRGDRIIVEGSVTTDDGTPVKRAPVGTVFICGERAEDVEGCRKGEIVCDIDFACGMCVCQRTDTWGTFTFMVKAPDEIGDFEMKVMAVDSTGGRGRVSRSTELTVG